jgi:hypothetical protein
MKIALLNWQMLVEVLFVLHMNWSMVLNVVFVNAPVRKWLGLKHAINIMQIGQDIKVTTTAKGCQVSDGWYADLVKDYHGSLLLRQILNPMMKQHLKFNEPTTLHHVDSIV